jgi:hypothetical protein
MPEQKERTPPAGDRHPSIAARRKKDWWHFSKSGRSGQYWPLGFCFLLFAATQTAVPMPAPAQTGFEYNGICHVSWWYDEYGYPAAYNSRSAMVSTGANWAALLTTWYQSTYTATTIARIADKTPTDDSLRAAIQDFHDKGLKVMLKPHVDPSDGKWRGEINPSNLEAWFTSYTQFMLHYALMAQELQVEGFCMGTELKAVSGAANRDRWIAVINAIRSVYSGILTYAANATYPGDEFTSVSFWDQLDLLGLDGYFTLTDKTDVTQADLAAAWRRNRYGEDLVATVQNFQGSWQKPLIFTELGYRSVDGANRAPWDFNLAGAYDPGEQKDCYAAAFQVWNDYNDWMKGFFWWAWAVPAPGLTDKDYTPRGKLAEEILRTWFITVPLRGSTTAAQQERYQGQVTAEEGRAAIRKGSPSTFQFRTQDSSASRNWVADPLAEAIRDGKLEVVRQLISVGEEVNPVRPGEKTPLMECAELGQVEMARILIEAGAELNATQRGWGTALELAERTGQVEVAALLLESGAHRSGKSIGDTVCVRPWHGNGFCGVVVGINKSVFSLRVTQLVGCTEGCPPLRNSVERRPIGGKTGIQVGDIVQIESSALTHTGI